MNVLRNDIISTSNDFNKLNSRLNDIIKFINNPVPVIYLEDIDGGKKVHIYCDGKNIKKDQYYGIVGQVDSNGRYGSNLQKNSPVSQVIPVYSSGNHTATAYIVYGTSGQNALQCDDSGFTKVTLDFRVDTMRNSNLVPDMIVLKTEINGTIEYEITNPWIDYENICKTQYRTYDTVEKIVERTEIEYETVIDEKGVATQVEKEVVKYDTVYEDEWSEWINYENKLIYPKDKPIEFRYYNCKALGFTSSFTKSFNA